MLEWAVGHTLTPQVVKVLLAGERSPFSITHRTESEMTETHWVSIIKTVL